MPLRQSLTIVAAARERVGKTLLARLLVDFYRHEQRPVAGFDLDPGERSLARFLPDCVSTAEIGDIRGQMALFDRLVAADDVNKVVDLGHQDFDRFFDLVQRIGLVEEVRRRSIAPAILFVLTPDPAAAARYRMLRDRFPDVTLTAVHNELFGILHHRETHPLLTTGSPLLRLPALPAALRRYVETPPFSFAAERQPGSTSISLTGYAEVQSWLRRVHVEFRELELRALLADLSSSIRLSS